MLFRSLFRGPDENAVFVDPHRHRNVDEAEQFVRAMRRVDQRRMGRRRRSNPRLGVFGVDVEGDGDDRATQRFNLFVQCLPPGQGQSAASPTGPGDHDDSTSAQ